MSNIIYNRAASLSDDVEGFFDGLIKGLVKHDVLHKLIESIKDDVSAKLHEHQLLINDRFNRLTTRLENIEFNMAVKDNTLKIIKERCERLEKKFLCGGKDSKVTKVVVREKKKKNTSVPVAVKNNAIDAGASATLAAAPLVCTCADKGGSKTENSVTQPVIRREKSVIVTSSKPLHCGKVRKDVIKNVRKNSKGSRKSCELRTKTGKKGLVFVSSSSKRISYKTTEVESKEPIYDEVSEEPPLPPKKREAYSNHDTSLLSSKNSSPATSPKRTIPVSIIRKSSPEHDIKVQQTAEKSKCLVNSRRLDSGLSEYSPTHTTNKLNGPKRKSELDSPLKTSSSEDDGDEQGIKVQQTVEKSKCLGNSRRLDSGLSEYSPTHTTDKINSPKRKGELDSPLKTSSSEDDGDKPPPKDILYPLRQSKLSMTLCRVRKEHEQNRKESLKSAAVSTPKQETTTENRAEGASSSKNEDEKNENIAAKEDDSEEQPLNGNPDFPQPDNLSTSSLEDDISPSGDSCGDSGCPDDEIKQEHAKESERMDNLLNHRKRSYSECGGLDRLSKHYVHEGPYDDLVDMNATHPDNITQCNVYRNIDREFKHIDDTIQRRSFDSSSDSKSGGSSHSDNNINLDASHNRKKFLTRDMTKTAHSATEITEPSFMCSEIMQREKSSLNGEAMRRKISKDSKNQGHMDTIRASSGTNHVKLNSGNKVICDIIIHKKKPCEKKLSDSNLMDGDNIRRKKKSSKDPSDSGKITIQYKKDSVVEKYGINTVKGFGGSLHTNDCNAVRRKRTSKNAGKTSDVNQQMINVCSVEPDDVAVSRRKQLSKNKLSENEVPNDHNNQTCDTIRYKKDSKTIKCSPPCEINFRLSNMPSKKSERVRQRTFTNCNEIQYHQNNDDNNKSDNNDMIKDDQFQDNEMSFDPYPHPHQEEIIDYDHSQQNYQFQDDDYHQNLNNKLEYFDEFNQDEDLINNINYHHNININEPMDHEQLLFDLKYQNGHLDPNLEGVETLNYINSVNHTEYANNEQSMPGDTPHVEYSDDENLELPPEGVTYEPTTLDNLARRNESPLSLYKNSDDGTEFPNYIDNLLDYENVTSSNLYETHQEESTVNTPFGEDSFFHQSPLSKTEFDNLYRLTPVDASPIEHHRKLRINKDGNQNKDGSHNKDGSIDENKNIDKYLDLQVRKNLRSPIKNALKDFVYRELHNKEKECSTMFNSELRGSLEYLRNISAMSYSDDCDVYGFNSSDNVLSSLCKERPKKPGARPPSRTFVKKLGSNSSSEEVTFVIDTNNNSNSLNLRDSNENDGDNGIHISSTKSNQLTIPGDDMFSPPSSSTTFSLSPSSDEQVSSYPPIKLKHEDEDKQMNITLITKALQERNAKKNEEESGQKVSFLSTSEETRYVRKLPPPVSPKPARKTFNIIDNDDDDAVPLKPSDILKKEKRQPYGNPKKTTTFSSTNEDSTSKELRNAFEQMNKKKEEPGSYTRLISEVGKPVVLEIKDEKENLADTTKNTNEDSSFRLRSSTAAPSSKWDDKDFNRTFSETTDILNKNNLKLDRNQIETSVLKTSHSANQADELSNKTYLELETLKNLNQKSNEKPLPISDKISDARKMLSSQRNIGSIENISMKRYQRIETSDYFNYKKSVGDENSRFTKNDENNRWTKETERLLNDLEKSHTTSTDSFKSKLDVVTTKSSIDGKLRDRSNTTDTTKSHVKYVPYSSRITTTSGGNTSSSSTAYTRSYNTNDNSSILPRYKSTFGGTTSTTKTSYVRPCPSFPSRVLDRFMPRTTTSSIDTKRGTTYT